MAIIVSISFPQGLLADIDTLAKKERRPRAELIREAARLYVERSNRWNKLFAAGGAAVRRKGLRQQDVAAEIRAHRRSRTSRRS
jgi:CopG family transcriptional regulator/antitoxin EndoAI